MNQASTAQFKIWDTVIDLAFDGHCALLSFPGGAGLAAAKLREALNRLVFHVQRELSPDDASFKAGGRFGLARRFLDEVALHLEIAESMRLLSLKRARVLFARTAVLDALLDSRFFQ